MEWICGVIHTPSCYGLRTIDENQRERLLPIGELQSTLACVGNLTKIRGTTSFSNWRELNGTETKALAEELGFTDGCNGQSFYEFNVGRERYLISSGALMCSMFRPFHGIAKYLFAPQGLDNLCTPYGNKEKPEVIFFIPPRTATGMQPDKAEGIINSLSWLHCFPSARRMWCSVVENAGAGQLKLILPKAAIKFNGTVRPLADNRALVCHFRIQLLETCEDPFPGFSSHTNSIEFERLLHKQDIGHRPGVIEAQKSVPKRGGEVILTDEEWSVLKPIVSRRPTRWNLRPCIDSYLEKMTSGLTWDSLAQHREEVHAHHRTITRMRSDGRWKSLMNELHRLRCSAPVLAASQVSTDPQRN